MGPDIDVDVLQVGVTLSEEEGADRHHRDDRQADDEEQRQPGKSQPVHRPELLEKKQLESAAVLRITSSRDVSLFVSHV
jgi:chloramphenicol 3-O-phosphotransferase